MFYISILRHKIKTAGTVNAEEIATVAWTINTFQVITQHVFLITTGHGNQDLSLVAEILLSDSEKYASYV
jgi:ATP adenylyltransferase/5',5'''-P-1,P-4-tetraphosphate phosphorylase II